MRLIHVEVLQRSDAPTRGSVVGGYALTERLAEGGMGVLWRATAPDGTAAALKVLRPPLAEQPHFRRRLAREIDALARLRGAHTPRLLAADPNGATPYLVMEHVPGPTIEQRLQAEGPLPYEELLATATGIGEALAEVHDAGLVHRDVKPNNVILSARGPVLIDFGIVQPPDAEPLTSADVVMGSPGWTAPELMTGARADAAADVFGWAGVAAYAATGRNPYGTGPTFAVLDRVRYCPPDLAGVPPQLVDLLQRAMRADPSERPEARELVRDLRRLRRRSRIRTAAAGAGLAAAALLAVSAGLVASFAGL